MACAYSFKQVFGKEGARFSVKSSRPLCHMLLTASEFAKYESDPDSRPAVDTFVGTELIVTLPRTGGRWFSRKGEFCIVSKLDASLVSESHPDTIEAIYATLEKVEVVVRVINETQQCAAGTAPFNPVGVPQSAGELGSTMNNGSWGNNGLGNGGQPYGPKDD